MKGNNTLILNEATMIEIVQQYLKRATVQKAPTVTQVETTSNGLFKVELSSPIAVNGPTSARGSAS